MKKRRIYSSKKMAEYARKGRGKGAFVPRRTKERDELQKRIERVVARALLREQMNVDVFRERGGLFCNRRMRGSKV